MDDFSGISNSKTFHGHRNLTCSQCTRYYNDPRLLPCHHTFCLSCVKTLCDKSLIKFQASPKKQKFACPKCGAHIVVPAEGVEAFPLDHKTQSLKEQVIHDLAKNISKSINNSREDTLSYAKNSSAKSENFHSYDSKKANEQDGDNKQQFDRTKDFSKYAKYFNNESSGDNDYKPTIKADHTRVGYESSTRFRNRRMNSKERQGSEEKELRRRTWYGSTLQARRAQSLNRASMFADGVVKENKTDNLFKISEDKEQTTANEASPSSQTFDKNTIFETQDRPGHHSYYEDNSEKTDYFRSKTMHPDDSAYDKVNNSNLNFEKTYKRDDKAQFGFGGSTRTSLPTHKENLITREFTNLDERRPDDKQSFDKHNASRSKRKSFKATDFIGNNFTSSEGPPTSMKEESFEKSNREPKTFVGTRHNRFHRSRQDDNKRYDETSFGRAHSVASREKLHLDINLEDHGEKAFDHENDYGEQASSPRRSRSRKSHKGRCKSVESRYSLNKSDFNTESEFREHLLNMTMSKEKYQRMMEDFKKGHLNNMRSDSTSIYDCEEVFDQSEEQNVSPEIKQESGENISTEMKPPKEPLIDENLILSFRAKYSSPLDIKRYPKQDAYPEFFDGVTKLWSCQKNEYGIPTSAVFLNEGKLVVAEYGLNSLEFFDATGHFEHNVAGIKPYGLTISGQSQKIMVGDRKSKCIRVFDEFGADVSQIDSLNNVEWLAGMASKRDGGLVLCDRGRCKILICTCSGEQISEFGSFGSSSKQLCMADFLVVDSKNRILVADSGNHCIKVFDPNGQYLQTIGSRGSEDGQLEWPKGIAIDDKDNIIVADTSNRRICLYSPDGLFINHLMTSIPDPYNITWSCGLLGVLHYNLKGMSQYDVYAY